MAISQLYSGTETVGTTEWSLTTDTSGPDVDTTDGIIQVWIDFSAVTAADTFEIKFYEKISGSGDTQRLFLPPITIKGVQASPIFVSPSFLLLHGWDVTLKKLAGTDRSITWSIRSVA